MTQKRRILIMLILLAALLLAQTALAYAGESIGWNVLSGGGGSAIHGSLSLGGSLGQPLAGEATVGTSDLCSGYWCGIDAYKLNLPVIRKH